MPSSRSGVQVNDEGSTTVEALVAALIVSLVAASAAFAFFSGIRAWAKNGEAIAVTSAALKADDSIRAACRSVRIPYWARSASLERDGDSWSIPFWKGSNEDALTLAPGDEGLVIGTPGETRALAGTELVSVTALPESGEVLRGVEVRYRVRGREFATIAAFGSSPIGEI